MKQYQTVLTIAGSDSGGGAGIQADLKTISALGCYGMSVITALTAQNTQTVSAIHDVPADFVAAQLDAVLGDIKADAIKIGMLSRAEVIGTVSEKLREYRVDNVVLDPVMVAKSGDRLLQDSAIDRLCRDLMPLATVLTPNLPEAEVLLGRKLREDADIESAASALLAMGPQVVLLKGGHAQGEYSSDLVASKQRREWLRAERINTANTHGTGCTLSSAVAAHLARGSNPFQAIASAKEYVSAAIRKGAEYRLGGGHGPVHHFHAFWS